MGFQLDISTAEVFDYGATDEIIDEESSVAGGKTCNHLSFD